MSKKKNFLVSKGLEHDFWIANLSFVITVAHITEFYNLWAKIQEVQPWFKISVSEKFQPLLKSLNFSEFQ
jgi:hypothetical protein